MFRGATMLSLDNKGRLVIPVRYRDILKEKSQSRMICTIDLHQTCLLLYPFLEWESIEKKLSNLSSMNPLERRGQRLLLGHASECEMDKSGRLLISATLRQHAQLSKEVMLIGQLNKFEIWSGPNWQQQIKDDITSKQPVQESLSERLKGLSL
ncbi:Protein MraZ [Candidatus Hamiltonella defensa (Bemisia tabaci)]|nr:Protein MraZ [Candidatus Hamiltonella defensa (Bemisia tabaci)]